MTVNLALEIVHTIIGYLPRQIQYKLLKSRDYAKSAHFHYYKYVSIVHLSDEQSRAQQLNQYINDSPLSFPIDITTNDLVPIFSTVKSFLIFYKYNPLYVPNILIIEDMEILNIIHYHKPSLLGKFRKISFVGINESVNLAPSLQLQYEQYGTSNISNIPNYVESLFLFHCYTRKLPQTIKILNVRGIDFDPDDLKLLPLLEHLFVGDYHGRLVPDLPNLKSLHLDEVLADMSKLTKLILLHINANAEYVSIGFDTNCDYQLPKSLSTLFLLGFNPGIELMDLSKIELRSLTIECVTLSGAPKLDLLLPETLDKIFLSDCSVFNLQFPESLKILAVQGVEEFSVSKVPLNVRSLDLIEMPTDETDFSKFLDLMLLSFFNPSGSQITFPPHLQYLTLFENMGNPRNELKTPKLLTSMTLNGVDASSLKSLDNLVEFKAVNLSSNSKVLAFNFKRLTSLFLHVLDPCNLPELPETLELLQLENSEFTNNLKCPLELKILNITDCKMSEPSINRKLEMLFLDYVKMDISIVLKKVGASLKFLYLENSQLKKLKVDLRNTSLTNFSMRNCQFKSKYVKFPKTLQSFRFYDINDDTSSTKLLDWLDISLCRHICEFYCPGTGYQKKRYADKLDKLLVPISLSITKLEI